jgi:hypothetical protein
MGRKGDMRETPPNLATFCYFLSFSGSTPITASTNSGVVSVLVILTKSTRIMLPGKM